MNYSRLTSNSRRVSTDDNTNKDSNYAPNSMSSLASMYSANKRSLELPALALACDRTGISGRSAATIASAILQD